MAKLGYGACEKWREKVVFREWQWSRLARGREGLRVAGTDQASDPSAFAGLMHASLWTASLATSKPSFLMYKTGVVKHTAGV